MGVLQISSDGDDRSICKGFEIFNSGIFLGGKIWQVFYSGGLFCCCCCCFFVVFCFISDDIMLSGNFLRLGNSAWHFLGFAGGPRDLGGLFFFSHSIIPVS